jgi:type IV pilus assembly protein PilY1
MWNTDVSNNTALKGQNNSKNITMPYISDVSGGDYTKEANYDGNIHSLPAPDAPSYDPTQWPIYYDAYPLQSNLSKSSAYNNPLDANIGFYDFNYYNNDQPCRGITYWQAIDDFSFKCSDSLGSIYSQLKAIPNLCDVSGFEMNTGVKTSPDVRACSSTLSDFAMYYWSNNLTGDKSYGVVPQQSVTANQTISYGGKSVIYPPFWNPQNDPATWQHMQTYTIGFGKQNQLYGGAGEITGTATLPAFDSFYGNFFTRFASGAVAWPATASSSVIPDANGLITASSTTPGNLYDLVHAAYNGRGKYYPATSATALKDAFDNILKSAISQSLQGGIASASASGSRLNSGTVAYVAGYAYDTGKKAYNDSTYWGTASGGNITGAIGGWSGSLTANAGDNLYTGPLWGASGATIPTARAIYTADANGKRISFEWSNLSNDSWITETAGLTAADVTAVRNNPLGDIVNSQLFYVGKPSRLSLDSTYKSFANSDTVKNRHSVVYVGANDGMLHGFDAGQGTPTNPGTGRELVAYVPRGLLGNLHKYTFADAGYTHRYWVDGSPFGGDAQLEASGGSGPGPWATVLAGTLGAGGPGYFVLDVTDPANIQVLIDKTVPGEDAYIGNQFSQPVMEMYTTNQPAQITRINTQDKSGEWAVIMGNGYNSASGVPVLLVQSLSHAGKPLYMVKATCTSTSNACIGTGNGLSAPRPIDVDGNGTADIVYAGDLMGNLWKFDISKPDHDQWQVAHTSGGQPAPMFTAVGPTGAAQPITSAPAVVPHPNGGFMVVFGTGKNLTDADAADTRLNSVYGLYDNTPMTAPAAANQVLLGSSTEDKTQPSPSPISATCRNGTGPKRYGGCLYQQTEGDLKAANAKAKGLQVGISSTLKNQQIDGQHYFGWYYDIPDVANGNAGKVLDNPAVMSGNTLMFYSQNVVDGTIGPPSTSVPESCDTVTLNSVLTTVNFFNVFTGNYPDNTITVLGDAYASGGGNRFQIAGATDFFHNGTDTLQSVHSSGGSGATIQNQPSTQPGRRAGWRIGR